MDFIQKRLLQGRHVLSKRNSEFLKFTSYVPRFTRRSKMATPSRQSRPSTPEEVFVTFCKHFEPSLQRPMCIYYNTKQKKRNSQILLPSMKSICIYDCQKISTWCLGNIIFPKGIMKTSSENYNSLLHLYFPSGIIGYYRKTEALISNWACRLWGHPRPLLGIVILVQQVISDLYRIAEVLNVNSIFPPKFLCTVPNPSGHHRPEAQFLDKIQTKS